MTETANKPLTEEEMVELDELLNQLPEKDEPMDDASMADGFMTAIQLLPFEIPTREWMGFILSGSGKSSAPETSEFKKLRSLLIRRYKEIGETLKCSLPINPIWFEQEEGSEQTPLAPFATGLLMAFDMCWDELVKVNDEAFFGSVAIISRYAAGGTDNAMINEMAKKLDKVYEVSSEEDVLVDIASSVSTIASLTRGYPIPSVFEDGD